MKDKPFENWGKWDGTEFDDIEDEEEKNYKKKQQETLRKMYGYNDKNDGGHPDSKQFKVELVSKELNHLAAILHVYGGV